MRTQEQDAAKRLDLYLHEQLPQYSRSRLQSWIKSGRVLVDGCAAKASHLLKPAALVEVNPSELPSLHAFAEDLPVRILYEDPAVIAVDKPAGMVVHSGAGNHSGTLVNALLHRFQSLSSVGGEQRPGIVHRLDRHTSGVLLVARTDAAHQLLAAQFASRQVEKVYLALVHGCLSREQGKVDKPIERDPVRRIKMTASTGGSGRKALTEYRVTRRFEKHTLLEVRIHTGRTHQIRVHLSSIGHPVVGDPLYGAPASPLGRYFLHSHRIGFISPATAQPVLVTSPLPPELEAYLEGLL
ncbi:MAG: RluA family pseudouridine synthase [Acidobacteriia bacterium]|nr:RluA family pseudouridine synthase [Terriglobia bacterium]